MADILWTHKKFEELLMKDKLAYIHNDYKQTVD